MSRLIVNADDFGYTRGINQAVSELHSAGALTSTTLMATGAAMEDAMARLALHTSHSLGVGCHVVLVDGTAVSPAETIASLLTTNEQASNPARFRPTLPTFAADLLRGRIREAEIEREAIAQIRLLQSRGVPLTHLDTHKHTHIFPRVLRPLLRAALQCGVKAIRNPFEPDWSLAATLRCGPAIPLLRRAEVRLLSRLRPEFARLVAEAGLLTTSGALGVLATGTLDLPTLEGLLGALHNRGSGRDVWELVCHPGYHDAALDQQATRLRAAREIERAALATALPGSFDLIHFGNLSSR